MKRKISAILLADIAGYSKLTAEDDEQTARQLVSQRALFEDLAPIFSGRVVNAVGDSILAEFPSAVEAVRYAINVQESLRTRNLAYTANQQMNWRIGVTIGDVVERDEDIMGDGVNIAARLESLAPSGGICVSQAVYDQVRHKMSVRFIDIGERVVKNIPFPVHAYTLELSSAAESETHNLSTSVQQRIWRRRLAVLLASGAVVVGAYHLIGMNLGKETPEIVLQAAHAQNSEIRQGTRRSCAQLKMICQQAGFQRGGGASGNGLRKDCVLPILLGTPQRPKATKPLPKVAKEIVVACRAKKTHLLNGLGSHPHPNTAQNSGTRQGARRSCAQLRMICQQAGFQRGGGAGGYGLRKDCVLPILRGTPQRPKATKPLPKVAKEIVAACRAKKAHLWKGLETQPKAESKPGG
jgi:class 3 adenylate cyclase